MCAKDFKNNRDSVSGKKSPRVLIYEPEEGNREVLCEALKKDYEIVNIQSIRDLKKYLEGRDFSILIINPEDEELKEAIRMADKGHSHKGFWIIVTSDKNEMQLGLNQLTYNRLIFIPKPYDLDIIEKTVSRIAQWSTEEGRGSKSLALKLARFLGLKR